MNEYVDLISNYGVMIIIVALFIWDWVANKKETKETMKDMIESNKETLNEMKKGNENTAKSLELLQKSMENQEHILDEVKEKCIEISANLKMNKE